MERVQSLRREARTLREIAGRCEEHAGVYRQLVALADKCERMADILNDKLGTNPARDPEIKRHVH